MCKVQTFEVFVAFRGEEGRTIQVGWCSGVNSKGSLGEKVMQLGLFGRRYFYWGFGGTFWRGVLFCFFNGLAFRSFFVGWVVFWLYNR